MSVAEIPVKPPVANPNQTLSINSLIGGALALVSLVFLFGGIPMLWGELLDSLKATPSADPVINPFLSGTFLFLIFLAAAIGLWFVAHKLDSQFSQHGLRSGVFFAALLFFLSFWIVSKLDGLMGREEADSFSFMIGGAAGVLMLGGTVWLFFQPGFLNWIRGIDDQGWFQALNYKPNQGTRVRRGTLIGLLIIFLCGVATLVIHNSLGNERYGPNDWVYEIPFTNKMMYIPLLFKVHVMLPILLALLGFWTAWRIINWPSFADFLIATEAEINKVSWTTRKRLVTDTIVVLVTVFLLSGYLFFLDVMWIKILSNPWVNVLQVNLKDKEREQQSSQRW